MKGENRFDEDGHFVPDPTPVEVPLRYRNRDTEAMRIARAVRVEMDQQLEKTGYEDFSEQMDFDIEDEFDMFPQSQFELKEMEDEYLPDDPGDREKTVDEKILEEEEKSEPKAQAEQKERENE